MALSGTGRLRLALAAGLVAVVAAVIWGWHSPIDSGSKTSGPKLGSGRGRESAKGEVSFVLTGDIESQRVKAASRVTEPDGTTRFRGSAEAGPVQVTLAYRMHGNPDKVTIEAASAEYHPTTQKARFEGAVKVATGLAGVELATNTLVYRGDEGFAESEDLVEFKRKQVSGSARGMTLAMREGVLTLPADVKLRIEDPLRGPVEIVGAHGVFKKNGGAFELEGGVQVRQAGSVLTAQRLVGVLAIPGYQLTQLTASGSVVLRSAGGAAMKGMGVGASSGVYTLRSPRLDMPLGEAGARRELRAGPGGVELVWSSGRKGAAGTQKRFEANAATFVMDAEGRLETVQGTKDVKLTQTAAQPAKGQPAPSADVIECASGYVNLDPATREITRGELLRDVVMTRGPMRAVAERGEFADSQLVLTGNPEVVNAESGMRLSAEGIQIGTGPKRGGLAAWGNVAHTMRRSPRVGSGEREGSLMTFTASRMDYNETKRSGKYNGDALLRMGGDEISARQILVRGAGSALVLHAYYNVKSRFVVADKEGHPGDAVEGRAGWLIYDERAAVLCYTYGVTFRQGDLTIETPDKLVVTLTPERALKQLDAGGRSVKIGMGARHASGVRLTYSPKDDAFRLTGERVVYEDGQGPGGLGLALTLFRAEDRILLDGRDLQRTVTTIKRGQPQQ
jgi:lipopolysaccharide export system protein LptA